MRPSSSAYRKSPNFTSMEQSQFWKIIDESRADFSSTRPQEENHSLQVARLTEVLDKLSPAEIASFQAKLDHFHRMACTTPLWNAAWLIHGALSDDSFDYFADWLISMGQKVFNDAMQTPDSLAAILKLPGIGFPSFEEFGYVAGQICEEKTRSEMPVPPLDEKWLRQRFEALKSWSHEELKVRLPHLWASYSSKLA